MNSNIRTYPLKSNIPPQFASTIAVRSFRKVTRGSVLVQISARFSAEIHLKERNQSRFNILMHQMIGDVDMFGSITYFVIVSDVDGRLIVAKHGSLGNRHIKFFEGVRKPDPLFCSECKSYIFSFTGRSRYRLLCLRTPTNPRIIEQKRVSGNALPSVQTVSIVRVGVSSQSNFRSIERGMDSFKSLVPLMYCRKCLVAIR
jgi:hypothetical protein